LPTLGSPRTIRDRAGVRTSAFSASVSISFHSSGSISTSSDTDQNRPKPSRKLRSSFAARAMRRSSMSAVANG
jgi:hypothetical protein